MELLIFGGLSAAIVYLLYDNRKLEQQARSVMKALIIETERRKVAEVVAYGRELDIKEVLEMDEIYED